MGKPNKPLAHIKGSGYPGRAWLVYFFVSGVGFNLTFFWRGGNSV